VPPRSQPSIAVSADGERWSVLNASPDIREQFARFEGLHPKPGTRSVPLDTLVLTSAELDHALGALVLREALSYRIVTSAWVHDAILRHNAAFRLLEPAWGAVALDRPFFLDRGEHLEARLFPVPGKVPGYLRDLEKNHKETCAGLRVTDLRSGRRLVFVPGLKSLDGTFYTADELQAMRPGAPDAFAMGHLPITGPGGSLVPLADLGGRTFYIHMNNTNPVLDAASEEKAHVRACGLDVAEDGLELSL
jgi:pyrroloquinoline quinone biosynthesis protein B